MHPLSATFQRTIAELYLTAGSIPSVNPATRSVSTWINELLKGEKDHRRKRPPPRPSTPSLQSPTPPTSAARSTDSPAAAAPSDDDDDAEDDILRTARRLARTADATLVEACSLLQLQTHAPPHACSIETGETAKFGSTISRSFSAPAAGSSQQFQAPATTQLSGTPPLGQRVRSEESQSVEPFPRAPYDSLPTRDAIDLTRPPQLGVSTKLKQHKCRVCGKRYLSKELLSRHARGHRALPQAPPPAAASAARKHQRPLPLAVPLNLSPHTATSNSRAVTNRSQLQTTSAGGSAANSSLRRKKARDRPKPFICSQCTSQRSTNSFTLSCNCCRWERICKEIARANTLHLTPSSLILSSTSISNPP